MKYLLLAGALIFTTTAAQSASFNCPGASQPDEIAICHNRTLNDKDVEMATTYQLLKGLFAMGVRSNMIDSQTQWLKDRRACKNDITCLNKRYDERLSTLNHIYQSIDKPI